MFAKYLSFFFLLFSLILFASASYNVYFNKESYYSNNLCFNSINLNEIFLQEKLNYYYKFHTIKSDVNEKVAKIKTLNFDNEDSKIPFITHHIYFTSKDSPRTIKEVEINKVKNSVEGLNNQFSTLAKKSTANLKLRSLPQLKKKKRPTIGDIIFGQITIK